MRDRPFIAASESPRPYSEVRAERRREDPDARRLDATLDVIAALEAEAGDDKKSLDERNRLQCEAEGLRSAISEARRD